MRYQYALTNRLGNRASNQDRCAIRHGEDHVLLVVADGMGGHARGDLAAQTAVETLGRLFREHDGPFADPAAFLGRALARAHEQVVRVGQAQQPPIEPRTTCVVCLVQGRSAWWAHVGDSRLYLLRDGQRLLRTIDHAFVEELLQRGEISADEARHHPMRNSVSQCLGGRSSLPEASFGQIEELHRNDCLLLCSDGLWSALPEQLLLTLYDKPDLNRALEKLAEDAERASYPRSDNISAVALRWLEHKLEQPAATPVETARRSLDPLDAAIDEIQRAITEYGSELDSGRK
jgi:serine/threonine protein phosphatase PrpC